MPPTHQRTPRPRLTAICSLAILLLSSAAWARNLTEPQVLLVYDSRISDSLLVAEHYAGSAKVPAGLGSVPGARPRVRVLDLASLPSPAGFTATTPQVSYADFTSKLRDPIRQHLTTNNLTRRIRAIVLTKGLPHRIFDTDNPNAQDNTGQAGAEVSVNDMTNASVDSELTLLFQDLDAGEAGASADSLADNAIVNPYHNLQTPVTAFPTSNRRQTPVLQPNTSFGILLWTTVNSALVNELDPGDLFLVTRLDANTVEDVRDMIDRAQNLAINPNAATFVLDESGSDGLDSGTNNADNEFDNDGPTFASLGDDYEATRDLLLADARFDPSRVNYDRNGNALNFFLGPNPPPADRTDPPGEPFGPTNLSINTPLLLLASLGENHSGIPENADFLYAYSYDYLDGATFNSIESFNARDLGGLGPGADVQQQCADFIEAGGTFALGTVSEPFSFSIADNLPLVRNFYLANLSFAEAAYSAIPFLSFHNVVLGDPLATVTRTTEDLDNDGLVTIDDLYAWHANPADLNRDAVADATDAQLLTDAIRAGEAARSHSIKR